MTATFQPSDTVRHMQPLVGGTITAVEAVDEDGIWPVIIVTATDGQEHHVVISRDPEGNGPGHAFVEEYLP